MSVSFKCPSCNTIHAIAERLVGRKARCPGCDVIVRIAPENVIPREQESEDADERGTVALEPASSLRPGDTVMLELVDIVSVEDSLPGVSATPHLQALPPLPHELEEIKEPDPFRKTRLDETEMDMTPMVDVTFQLLIFFMITAAFALQKAKEIPKPKEDDPSTAVVQQDPEEASDTVRVKIDEYNTFIVVNVDGDEEEAPSVQDLYIKLKRAKTIGSSGKTPTKLRVEAHGEAFHEKVVAALDAGNEMGFAELELTSANEDE